MKFTEDKGFTLVELMIVVAILGVLAAVAIPTYRGYIETARASEATTNLQTIALLEEQYFSDNGEYVEGKYKVGDTTLADPGVLPGFHPGLPADLFFEYIVTAGTNPHSFDAEAIRTADTGKTFTINEKNEKSW